MDELMIEAKVMRSLSGPFYQSAILRGCQLTPISKSGSVINKQRYQLYLTGRAVLQPYTLLTYWTATGVFAETESPEYWILQVVPGAPLVQIGFNEKGYFGIKGPLEILAQAHDEDRVGWLKHWWMDWLPEHGGQNEVTARWLGELTKKGVKDIRLEPPPVVETALRNPPFFPDEAWVFDLPN